MNCDYTLFAYLFVAATATWGAVLFTIRIVEIATRTNLEVGPVYAYVTVMFYGIALTFWTNTWARILRARDTAEYIAFMGSWWWSARTVVFGLAILAIVVHMTARWIRTKSL